VVDSADPTRQWSVVADGTILDPAIVYVRVDGEWINLAVLAGLPGSRRPAGASRLHNRLAAAAAPVIPDFRRRASIG
jgi:hypothetical protein